MHAQAHRRSTPVIHAPSTRAAAWESSSRLIQPWTRHCPELQESTTYVQYSVLCKYLHSTVATASSACFLPGPCLALGECNLRSGEDAILLDVTYGPTEETTFPRLFMDSSHDLPSLQHPLMSKNRVCFSGTELTGQLYCK
jgi:hypothetical protein